MHGGPIPLSLSLSLSLSHSLSLSERPGPASEGSQVGGTDGRMDVRMYGCTDSPCKACILQDFAPSGSLWSRCPAYMIAAITKYQSRGRVPMTNSCLWATGYHQKRYFLIAEINGKWVIQTHTHTHARACNHVFARASSHSK